MQTIRVKVSILCQRRRLNLTRIEFAITQLARKGVEVRADTSKMNLRLTITICTKIRINSLIMRVSQFTQVKMKKAVATSARAKKTPTLKNSLNSVQNKFKT